MTTYYTVIHRDEDGASNVDWIMGDWRSYREMGGDLDFSEWAIRAYPECVEEISSEEYKSRYQSNSKVEQVEMSLSD